MLTDARLTAIREGAHGCGVCLTFADYPAEHQPGCDECIFASREGAAILEELIAARTELTRLRAMLWWAHNDNKRGLPDGLRDLIERLPYVEFDGLAPENEETNVT